MVRTLFDKCKSHIHEMFEGELLLVITCSAVILYADWSIGIRPGSVHTLLIQYRMAEFNITTWAAALS